MALQSVSFTKPGADPSRNQFERQRRIAEALQAQAFAPEQTQMAGGYAVPQGVLSPVAKIAQAWAAKSMGERADKGEQDYVRQQGARRAEDIARAMQAGQAVPAQPAQDIGQDELTGENRGVPAVAGRAPDPQAIYLALAGSEFPELQQAGMSGMLAGVTPKDPVRMRAGESLVDPRTGAVQSTVPMQPNWQIKEIKVEGGGVRTVQVDMNAPDPLATAREVGAQGPRMEMVNTGGTVTPVNPYQPPAGPLEKSPEIPAGFTRGPNGQLMADPGYVAGKSQIARAGASNTQNTVINAGPKAFETELGKMDAEQLGEMRKAAQSAQASLSTVANLRSAIERGVYSGGTANLQTDVASIINGITGITPKGLPGSELFNAESSKLVVEYIKKLGANPSNTDLAFVQKIVPRLASSPEARNQLIDYIEQSANTSIKLFQDADAYARANRGLGGFQIVQPPRGGAAPPYAGPDRRAPAGGAAPVYEYDANGKRVK